jgi:hypothetical protein
MSIDAIGASQIVSMYTRTSVQGNHDVTTQYKHVEENGSIKIEATSFSTYNQFGKEVTPVQQGARVDITI